MLIKLPRVLRYIIFDLLEMSSWCFGSDPSFSAIP